MGQSQCCQPTNNNYHNYQQLSYKFQNINITKQPIQSSQMKLILSTATSNQSQSQYHYLASNNQGKFIDKQPQLNYQLKQKLLSLNPLKISQQTIRTYNIYSGQKDNRFFLFKRTSIIYQGQWENGKPNGYGSNYYPNGGYYQGTFIDGVPHGYGRLIMPNSDLYQGDIKFGRANGKGYFMTKTGQYQGQFKDNLRHGYGQQHTSQLLFSGIFQYGDKKSGVMKFNGGDIYEGNFQNNLFEGIGKLTTTEGVYEGSFRNGLKHGIGYLKWKDGSYYKGDYYQGQRQGEGDFYNKKNNSISRGFWKNGILEGQGEYIEKSKIYRCVWSEGKLVGLRN